MPQARGQSWARCHRHNALNARLDVLAPLHAATGVGTQFDAIKAKQGLKAAFAWRKAQFEGMAAPS